MYVFFYQLVSRWISLNSLSKKKLAIKNLLSDSNNNDTTQSTWKPRKSSCPLTDSEDEGGRGEFEPLLQRKLRNILVDNYWTFFTDGVVVIAGDLFEKQEDLTDDKIWKDAGQ